MVDCNVEDRPTVTTIRSANEHEKNRSVVVDIVVNHKHKHNYPWHVD